MIYLFDENGYFSGAYEHKKGNALPLHSFTDTPPPTCSADEIPKMLNDGWAVVSKPSVTVVDIEISNVTNRLDGFDDKDHQYTVAEMTESIATGSGLSMLHAMGLKKFRVPFVRTDTQRKAYMVSDIAADGTFSMKINFKTGGEWVVNTELLNSELSEPELALFSFAIPEHKFKVI